MKKTTLSLIALFVVITSSIYAQTARVQVIHNSADLAAEEVDLYINNIKFIENFAFRTATAFVDIGAGINLKINIAPGDSSSVADSIYELNTTLTEGETYLLIATGNISSTGYTATNNFGIEVFNMGQETSSSASEVELLFAHGATDAPAVDINIVANGNSLADDLAYTDFQGYVTTGAGDFTLEMTTADGSTALSQYIAPFNNLGLGGEAVTVLASGFLSPAANSNGPEFGLWLARPAGGNLIELRQPKATIQLIHNSADLAAEEVDVYLNDILFLDDFKFRTATPFRGIPADIDVNIKIAPGNSSSSADFIYELDTSFIRDRIYILVADGNVSSTGYTQPNSFGINVFDQGKVNASNPTLVDILFHNGVTDGTNFDVEISGFSGKLTDDLGYPDFDGYTTVGGADFTLDVISGDESTEYGQYTAPFGFLGLGGDAITVVFSGFLEPANNSEGPGFGLWAATPEGGNLIKLTPKTAEVQVIHNSADAAASIVDVYVNDKLIVDDFAFRTATPFVEVPSGYNLSIEIAPSTSSSANESIFEYNGVLTRDESYILVADGNISSSGYTQTENFSIEVYEGAQISAPAGNTRFLVHHGSTDAPTVDIREAITRLVLVNDISYPEFDDDYIELPTNDYFIDVTTADETVIVETYLAEFSTLGLDSKAVTVVASGFLDPSQNNNGPAFGLWVASQNGGALVQLPTATLGTNDFEELGLSVFPNPVKDLLNIKQNNSLDSQLSINDLSGRIVLTRDLKGLNNTLDLSGLNSGIYILTIINDEGNGSMKIVKN